jgi:hypothetical protein
MLLSLLNETALVKERRGDPRQVNGGIVLSRLFERKDQMLWAVLDDLAVLHLYDPVGLT